MSMKNFGLKLSQKHQTTIERTVKMRGVSSFSREACTLEFLPAPANSGITFVAKGQEIPATIKYLDDSEYTYTTSLTREGATIRTVEHVLSAVAGLGIDNLIINLPQGVIPARSSSAEEYCRELLNAGIVELEAFREVITPLTDVLLYDSEGDGWANFAPADQLTIHATLKFDNIIGEQSKTFRADRTDYLHEIADCRSCMRAPLETDSWKQVRQLLSALPEDPTLSPMVIFNKERYITPLKKPDEPVGYKILDMLGDLSLVGKPIQAEINIYKPRHEFNQYIADKIWKSLRSN
jgi:UDP-3-O-[3-hydroxymyristoyl] N-acetylglucosamine deacetylase